MAALITGTGVAVPPNVVTNDALTRIMDTSDEWIVSRTGVRSRRFVDPGTSTSDLGAQAVRSALADAGVDPSEVDAVVCATMTPDRQNPGIAGAVQHKSGLHGAAVFDLRQQCSGFLFGLDLADMLITTERARTVVVVGAEVHAGYLPWGDAWDIVLGRADRSPTDDERALATRHRAWSVLFGDGAGAMVLQTRPDGPGLDFESESGILGSVLRTDGAHADLIEVPGLGSEQRPYADEAQIAAGLHHPTMNGGGLYRLAVETMPAAVREVLKTTGFELDDLGLVVAHQANDRILDGARRRLGVDESIMPSNIGHWGNTTAGTLPILYHELREQGRVAPGTLVAFTSFGAGAHWGAVLYSEPENPGST
ncbi:MAG: 3-oxoacyl-ACP synthase [Acidimicrobiaceae bacterium]|nr:3-oxoacyl-ACP synthase [Acidimicrobiaceae bacterium]MYG56906.1 3-oxoacyl-ACP synthase [Acidimicrobiaceae bacterium]MYJ99982.1 3-oxoacyl-ACP synthase [Acidimicrobiaceae bacterium]